MNHHHEHEHDVVNGGQVNGSRPTEEELDAYQNQLTDEAIQDQVKTFFIAQEKRVLLYRDYEKYRPKSLRVGNGSAFRGYMRGESSEAELAGIISSSTSSFNDLSQRINRCEVALRDDLNRSDLAGLIRRIQDNEKIKLEATVKGQMWEREQGERDFTNDIEDAKRRRDEAIDSINEIMEEIRAEVY